MEMRDPVLAAATAPAANSHTAYRPPTLSDPSIESRQLPPMTVRHHQQLHIRDLIVPDQPPPAAIAQLPQVHVHRQVFVVGALAIPFDGFQALRTTPPSPLPALL